MAQVQKQAIFREYRRHPARAIRQTFTIAPLIGLFR